MAFNSAPRIVDGESAESQNNQQSAITRALLSSREAEILSLIIQGLTNKEIAAQIFLSPETVKTYVARILKKLGARNRTEAVVRTLGTKLGEAQPAEDSA